MVLLKVIFIFLALLKVNLVFFVEFLKQILVVENFYRSGRQILEILERFAQGPCASLGQAYISGKSRVEALNEEAYVGVL